MGGITTQYLYWHFVSRPKVILKAWRNYLWYNLRYWSVPLLIKTLFSYWHKYSYSYGRGFNPQRFFEAFTFNMISRVLGAIMRIFLILAGIIAEIFVFCVGLIVFLGWIFLPFLLIAGIWLGLSLIV